MFEDIIDGILSGRDPVPEQDKNEWDTGNAREAWRVFDTSVKDKIWKTAGASSVDRGRGGGSQVSGGVWFV